MGDAFVAIADDAYAIVYNPAGLANMDHASATFDYADLYNLGLLKNSFLGAVFPTRWGTHGLSYKGLRVDLPGFDEGQVFGLTETTLGYSYAYNFGQFSLGTTAKYFDLNSDFALGTGTGFGLDLGAYYQVSDRWSIGGSVQNIFSNIRFGTGTSEAVPTSWRLGTALRLSERWNVTGEYAGISGEPVSGLKAGTEYWIMRPSLQVKGKRRGDQRIFADEGDYSTKYPFALGVRTGIDKQQSGADFLLPTLGFTAGFGPVRLDYAFVAANKSLGSTHRYSLSYDFEPWVVDREKKPIEQLDEKPNPKEYVTQPDRLQEPGAHDGPRGPVIAVLDFANATGYAELAWLEAGFGEIIDRALESGGFATVNRSRLTGTAAISGPAAIGLANENGARLIIRGLFVRNSQGTMTLTARLIDTQSGRTLEYVEAQGPEKEIFEMGKAIAQKSVSWAEALVR